MKKMVYLKLRDLAHWGVLKPDEVAEATPVILEIIGFVIREDDQVLVMASEHIPEDNAWRDATAVPKEVILERRYIQFEVYSYPYKIE